MMGADDRTRPPRPAPLAGQAALLSRLRRAHASRRRLRHLVLVLASLLAALVAGTAHHPPDIRLSREARGVALAAGGLFPSPVDPIYDEALREFGPLRGHPARRRTLAALLLAAAAEHGVDPDLLFAVVAVESAFEGRAVSPRGARGLGQLLFTTARSVAPERIRRPADLHEPAPNLDATARLLRQLLTRHQGALDRALRAYYGGPWDRGVQRPDRERYGVKVATRYAALKALRAHRSLAAAPAPAERGTAGARGP